MAQSSCILEATGLCATQGGRKVLEIPQLQIPGGQVTAVIGPNGSGKTSLILCLALLLKPAAGEIRYRGLAVNGSDRLALRRKFAVVFQEPLLLNGTAWDNVALGLRLRGRSGREIKERTEKWLRRFGVSSLAQRQARTLSGGEAKRVSLARAFALEPEVIFLDEPFSALDIPTHQALLDDLEAVLGESKVTTVIVTHDRNEALTLADRVAVLIGGAIRQVGTPQEVFSWPATEEVAGFVGAGNVLYGTVVSQRDGLASMEVAGRHLDAVSGLAPGSRVAAFLQHEDITVWLPATHASPGSARNNLSGRIARISPLGSQVRVTIDCGFPLTALITKRSCQEMALSAGREVVASFKASSVHLIARKAES